MGLPEGAAAAWSRYGFTGVADSAVGVASVGTGVTVSVAVVSSVGVGLATSGNVEVSVGVGVTGSGVAKISVGVALIASRVGVAASGMAGLLVGVGCGSVGIIVASEGSVGVIVASESSVGVTVTGACANAGCAPKLASTRPNKSIREMNLRVLERDIKNIISCYCNNFHFHLHFCNVGVGDSKKEFFHLIVANLISLML
jgi:hypothetical protein